VTQQLCGGGDEMLNSVRK